MMPIKTFWRFRYIFLIVSAFSFLSCVFFIWMGIVETSHAIAMVISPADAAEHANPGVLLFEALDRFLISVLFYIFGIGMIKLFMPDLFQRLDLPEWLNIKDIKELKVLLWETVLVTLMVKSVTELVAVKDRLTWNALILPAVIATLSVSLFFMRSRVDKGGSGH